MNSTISRLALAALLLSPTANGAAVEEIVVTASMAEEGYYEMPAVTLKRKADFLVQAVRFVNDSRSPDLRRSEIIGSIAKLMESARKQNGVEVSYGDGFLLPVDLTDDSLQFINDRQRTDTNYVDIYVKLALDGSSLVKDQIARLRKFITDQKFVGRTELELRGDIALSIVKPEQYRYEILRKVAAENEQIREIVGTECSITVRGLEGRVSWERTAVDELTLYIPYGTEVECAPDA